jgi:hypothetical protein
MGTKTKRKRQLDSVRSISFEARYDSKLIDPDDGNTNALSAHHEADAHMQTGYEGSMQEEMDFMSESLLPLPSFLERLVSCARAPTKKLRNPVYNGDSERSGERWIKEQKELRELAKTNHKITEYMPRKNAIDEIESHDNSKEVEQIHTVDEEVHPDEVGHNEVIYNPEKLSDLCKRLSELLSSSRNAKDVSQEKKEIQSNFDFVRMICILDFFRLLNASQEFFQRTSWSQ